MFKNGNFKEIKIRGFLRTVTGEKPHKLKYF